MVSTDQIRLRPRLIYVLSLSNITPCIASNCAKNYVICRYIVQNFQKNCIYVIFSPNVDISEESLNRSGCSLPDQTRPKLNTSRERSIQADLTEYRSFKDTGVGSSTVMGLWSTPRKLDKLQLPIMSPIAPQRTRPRGRDSSTPDRPRRTRPRQQTSSGLEGKNTDFII